MILIIGAMRNREMNTQTDELVTTSSKVKYRVIDKCATVDYLSSVF